MPASASSASPEIVKRNGAPGTGSGSSGRPSNSGSSPSAGRIGAGAVARGLLVELGLQHREVQRGVLRHGVIDDRLDAGGQTVLHAVRHVGAEPRRRQDRRAEAAAAGSDAAAVGGGLPPGQPASHASTAWLTWVSSERSTEPTVVPGATARPGAPSRTRRRMPRTVTRRLVLPRPARPAGPGAHQRDAAPGAHQGGGGDDHSEPGGGDACAAAAAAARSAPSSTAPNQIPDEVGEERAAASAGGAPERRMPAPQRRPQATGERGRRSDDADDARAPARARARR